MDQLKCNYYKEDRHLIKDYPKLKAKKKEMEKDSLGSVTNVGRKDTGLLIVS